MNKLDKLDIQSKEYYSILENYNRVSKIDLNSRAIENMQRIMFKTLIQRLVDVIKIYHHKESLEFSKWSMIFEKSEKARKEFKNLKYVSKKYKKIEVPGEKTLIDKNENENNILDLSSDHKIHEESKKVEPIEQTIKDVKKKSIDIDILDNLFK